MFILWGSEEEGGSELYKAVEADENTAKKGTVEELLATIWKAVQMKKW